MVHFSNQFQTYKKNREKENNRRRQMQWAEREKVNNLQSFNKKNSEKVHKTRQKQREADFPSFNKKHAEQVEKTRQKQKEADLLSFNKKNVEQVEKTHQRQGEADLLSFNKKNAEQVEKTRQRQREAGLDTFNERRRREKCKRKANTTERHRIFNFKRAVLFGPIFICSCCRRRLYEKSVTEITANLVDKIESKQPGLYKKCIPEEKTVKFLFNGIEKKGIYICSTCKTTMLNGKLPSMTICNVQWSPTS